MFICFKPVLQLSKCTVKAILKLVSFRTQLFMIPVTPASIGYACKFTVGIGIVYVQVRKVDTKTENYQQNNEEH